MKISRRTFLSGVIAAVAGTVIGIRYWWSGNAAGRGAQTLVALLNVPGSAAVLGSLYLDQVPSEANTERLVILIEAGLPETVRPVSSAPKERLRQALASSIRNDFDANRIVRVGGWLLSGTEARLCALAALSLPLTPLPGSAG